MVLEAFSGAKLKKYMGKEGPHARKRLEALIFTFTRSLGLN